MRERSRFAIRSAFTSVAVITLSLAGASTAYPDEGTAGVDDPVCSDIPTPEVGSGSVDDPSTTDESTTDPDCPDDDGTPTDDGDCAVGTEPGDDGSAPPEELTEDCEQIDDPDTGECSNIGGGGSEPGDGGSAGEETTTDDDTDDTTDDTTDDDTTDDTTDDDTTDDTTDDDTDDDTDDTTDDDTTDDDTTDDGESICPVAVGAGGDGEVDCSPDPSACYEAAAGDPAPLATDAAVDGPAATAAETLPVTGGVAGVLAPLGVLCIALGAALLEGQRRLVARGRLTPSRRRL